MYSYKVNERFITVTVVATFIAMALAFMLMVIAIWHSTVHGNQTRRQIVEICSTSADVAACLEILEEEGEIDG